MAGPNPTTALDLGTTYRLRSWNELWAIQTKRFYHAGDGDGTKLRTVEITPDLRIACRCGIYRHNLIGGFGPCDHVAEAIDFIDAVGYSALPTWRQS